MVLRNARFYQGRGLRWWCTSNFEGCANRPLGFSNNAQNCICGVITERMAAGLWYLMCEIVVFRLFLKFSVERCEVIVGTRYR